MTAARAFDHVYLSPHLDDAVFSCGGAIAAQRARGERVLVVTVCAGLPPPGAPPPALLREGLEAAGLTPTDFVQLRRAEDARALAVLDAEHEWADALDAVYRLPERYGTLGALLGEVAAADPLPDFVTELVGRLAPEAILYAPLGVGQHVDHRIVCAAGMKAGARVLLYEDFPYAALDAAALSRRLAVMGVALDPILVDVSATLDQRIAAASCYATQIVTPGAIGALISAHANRVGDGVPAERLFAVRPRGGR